MALQNSFCLQHAKRAEAHAGSAHAHVGRVQARSGLASGGPSQHHPCHHLPPHVDSGSPEVKARGGARASNVKCTPEMEAALVDYVEENLPLHAGAAAADDRVRLRRLPEHVADQPEAV
ncbi:hypothetical protein GQ600_4536 [Phytophthora cactorum]|nr:hypothetical protein GQ600_4536 [Phytophthora cactorum]